MEIVPEPFLLLKYMRSLAEDLQAVVERLREEFAALRKVQTVYGREAS